MNNTNLYRVSPGPHIRCRITTGDVMYDVLLSLLPAAVFGVWHFGLRALLLMVTGVFSAVSMEFVFNCLTGRDNTLRDGSAAVTGLLLALSLPPDAPAYMAYIGAAVAVVLAKGVFGGLGRNRLNPALAGRCLLMVAFGGAMTGFLKQSGWCGASMDTAALARMLLGTQSAVIGGSVIALLIGGIYLLAAGGITWHIPVSAAAGYFVLALLFHGAAGALEQTLFFLSGGGMLAAFFMATDPVTSPVSDSGQILYGLGIALLSFLLRETLFPAEAVCCAVLLANLAAPLIDRFTIPSPRV